MRRTLSLCWWLVAVLPAQSPPAPDMPASRPAPSTPAAARATVAGLTWLLRHQAEDGSWSQARVSARCDAGHGCAPAEMDFDPRWDAGQSALALLAFLHTGYTVTAPQELVDTLRQKRHPIGPALQRGFAWLINQQRPDGGIGLRPVDLYGHALATRALCLGAARAGGAEYAAPARKAVAFLLAAQRQTPLPPRLPGTPAPATQPARLGFAPVPPGAPGDPRPNILATACAALALQAATDTGIPVPPEAHDGMLRFARQCLGPGGLVGWLGSHDAGKRPIGPHAEFTDHPALLIACGSVLLQQLPGPERDAVQAQLRTQLERDRPPLPPEPQAIDYLFWHAATVALARVDAARTDPSWGAWQERLVATLTALQDQGAGCGRGGWLTPDRWSSDGGPVFATALNVLTLGAAGR